MALADYSLCVVRSNSGNLGFGAIQGERKTENYSRNRKIGMEFEPDWTRHKKSSAFKTQVISTATSWARKIPISEGYHEFL
ncbi:hypothetical protein L1987_11257 [Smallanthus sonchifolius]|uniref:Uncharacterized protein n=1 Tax=Smallanthus sonchifolius TaxID=185202 RepID=A0ACB9JCK5_9ASTR|nr:hypothetical protein L1987_11257 [Smallanthus sonchifolius]